MLSLQRLVGIVFAAAPFVVGCGDPTIPETTFVVAGSAESLQGPVEDASVTLSFLGACTIGGCYESDRSFGARSGVSGAFIIRAVVPAGQGCRGSWRLDATHPDYYLIGGGGLLRAWMEHDCSPFELSSLVLTLEPYPLLAVLTTSLPSGTVGVQYGFHLESSRTRDIAVWSIAADVLPPDLTLSPDGQIAGLPTTSGTWSFTVEVRTGTWLPNGELDENGLEVAQAELTLTVTDP